MKIAAAVVVFLLFAIAAVAGPITKNTPRFLLYGVNPGEGFNLRRDVFVRVVMAVWNMPNPKQWTIVLPPWTRLRHWRNSGDDGESRLPWSALFDLDTIRPLVNVMEFDEYVRKHGHKVDHIVVIKRHQLTNELLNDPNWSNAPSTIFGQIDADECAQDSTNGYVQNHKAQPSDSNTHPIVLQSMEYGPIPARSMSCVRSHADVTQIAPPIAELPHRSILVGSFESVHFGALYWGPERQKIRKAFTFSKALKDESAAFVRSAFGDEPYLAVHMRRGDFFFAHPDVVPTLERAAEQIKAALAERKLTHVFVASDMTDAERQQLSALVPFRRFTPASEEASQRQHVAELAIIDQIICSKAAFFIGTTHSSFTLEIQRERELLFANPSSVQRDFVA